MRPDDQLDLTEGELNEEITKQLDTENTNYFKNLVIYSFKDYEYVPVSMLILFKFKLFVLILHILLITILKKIRKKAAETREHGDTFEHRRQSVAHRKRRSS